MLCISNTWQADVFEVRSCHTRAPCSALRAHIILMRCDQSCRQGLMAFWCQVHVESVVTTGRNCQPRELCSADFRRPLLASSNLSSSFPSVRVIYPEFPPPLPSLVEAPADLASRCTSPLRHVSGSFGCRRESSSPAYFSARPSAARPSPRRLGLHLEPVRQATPSRPEATAGRGVGWRSPPARRPALGGGEVVTLAGDRAPRSSLFCREGEDGVDQGERGGKIREERERRGGPHM
jgi:hypothetical protein